MTGIAGYAKAVVAFLLAGLGSLYVALAATSGGGEQVTQAEWVGVLIAALGTTAGVFAVPNKTASRDEAMVKSMQHDPDPQSLGDKVLQARKNERGESTLYLVVLVLVGIAALIFIARAI